jgi:hypothetical protein
LHQTWLRLNAWFDAVSGSIAQAEAVGKLGPKQ